MKDYIVQVVLVMVGKLALLLVVASGKDSGIIGSGSLRRIHDSLDNGALLVRTVAGLFVVCK